MNPSTFNDLMTVISGHVSHYLNERVSGVVSLLCEKYNLSYEEVVRSIPETMSITDPIVTKKYKKKIKFVVSAEDSAHENDETATEPEPTTPKAVLVTADPCVVVPEVTEPTKPNKRTKAADPVTTPTDPDVVVPEVTEPTKPNKRTKAADPVTTPTDPDVVVPEVTEPTKPNKRTKAADPVTTQTDPGVVVPEMNEPTKPKKRTKAAPVTDPGVVVPEMNEPTTLIKPKKRTKAAPVTDPGVVVPEMNEPTTLIKPKKRTKADPVTDPDVVVPEVTEPKKPKKRTTKTAPVASATEVTEPTTTKKRAKANTKNKNKHTTTGAQDIKIEDLPADEAAWFNDILQQPAKGPQPELKPSFFPAHPVVLPPECDVYSDDDILDDYPALHDDEEDDYGEYVLEE
jgi:hypothetical protein